MKANLFLPLLFSLLTSVTLLAQTDQERAEEYRLQAEQRMRAQIMQVMDSAIALLDEGLYARADEKFKYVLANLKSVPSDLTFYFGKNSFYLNKFKQSTDWLTKYIQLKGTMGTFSAEAVELLKKAEVELRKEQTKNTANAEQVLSRQYDIDCGPAGKVTCPVCKGSTVLIRKGAFDNQYKTCPYCSKHGFLTCEEYNQLIRGELQPRPE